MPTKSEEPTQPVLTPLDASGQPVVVISTSATDCPSVKMPSTTAPVSFGQFTRAVGGGVSALRPLRRELMTVASSSFTAVGAGGDADALSPESPALLESELSVWNFGG